VAFVFPLMWWLGLGHVGLALATSVSAWLNALLLYRGLRRDAVLSAGSVPLKWFLQVALATASMALMLWWLMADDTGWADWSWWQRATELGMLCFSGLSAFVAGLWLMGFRPADLRR
jgi:putative peptidoglycan lipid II flippase